MHSRYLRTDEGATQPSFKAPARGAASESLWRSPGVAPAPRPFCLCAGATHASFTPPPPPLLSQPCSSPGGPQTWGSLGLGPGPLLPITHSPQQSLLALLIQEPPLCSRPRCQLRSRRGATGGAAQHASSLGQQALSVPLDPTDHITNPLHHPPTCNLPSKLPLRE